MDGAQEGGPESEEGDGPKVRKSSDKDETESELRKSSSSSGWRPFTGKLAGLDKKRGPRFKFE